MSQSQHSDVFPSTLYDDTDSIQYLVPENPKLFTPEPSSSQQTFDLFEQVFLRPQPCLSIPSLFKCVGPDRRKAYVLYDNMMNTEWVEWWLETDCGKTSKINWDANHQSTIWKEFYQVANSSDGAPKVMCKRCGLILEHPSSLLRPGGKTRHGTSSLIRHRTTAACLKAASGAQTTGITKFLRDTVSSFLFKKIIY